MELELATLEGLNAWSVKEYDPETMPNYSVDMGIQVQAIS
jgi:hypothetical protein